jgi:RNA polymerase sigma factor (sigma-70 family)
VTTPAKKPARPTDAEVLAAVRKHIHYHAWRLAGPHGGGLDADDLKQEARIAALVAARRFDPAAGVTLYTFLHRRVVGAMLDALLAYQEEYRRASRTVLATRIQLSALPDRDACLPPTRDPSPADPPAVEFAAALRRVSGVRERDREVAALVYAEGQMSVEVARRVGLSDGRVSQILKEVREDVRETAERRGWTEADVAERLGVLTK